jgi:hypothetical protein
MIVAQVIEAVIAARLIRGAPIPSPDPVPWAVAAPRNDPRLRIRRASSATAAELATIAGARVICAGMLLSGMRYTKAALLIFGAGSVLGLVVVSVKLPGLARLASAAMAVGIAALPVAIIVDLRRKTPAAPAKRRRKAATGRRRAPPRQRAPRRR